MILPCLVQVLRHDCWFSLTILGRNGVIALGLFRLGNWFEQNGLASVFHEEKHLLIGYQSTLAIQDIFVNVIDM